MVWKHTQTLMGSNMHSLDGQISSHLVQSEAALLLLGSAWSSPLNNPRPDVYESVIE